MAFVSALGVRPVEFVRVEEGGTSLERLGPETMAWDAWDTANGQFTLMYKYRGAGGCGQLVTYTLTQIEGAPGFAAKTIREQPCSSGPPDFEPLPDDVIFNEECGGEPCFNPHKWLAVWSAE
jgi:hypothetical protein